MKFTEDVRGHAATSNHKEVGMAAMSVKFEQMGGQVYADTKAMKDSDRASHERRKTWNFCI
jgi:hypothetical protein